jgi:hypothetical protein
LTAASSRQSVVAANAQTDAMAARFGYLRVYSGSRPARPEDPPPADARLLAEVKLPPFEPARDGRAELAYEPSGQVLAAGRPSWCRIVAKDGKTALCDDTADVLGLSERLEVGLAVVLGTFWYGTPMAGTEPADEHAGQPSRSARLNGRRGGPPAAAFKTP